MRSVPPAGIARSSSISASDSIAVPCGACDWCLRELEPVADPLVLAQKIGSCVARVKGRFGLAHVSAVLEGKRTPQVTAQGHDTLSTFGLLAGTPSTEIRGYVEQLIAQEFLVRTAGDYPIVQLTAKGIDMLRGQVADGGRLVPPAPADAAESWVADGNLAD